MSKLKNTAKLHRSSIVANSLMNRERELSGGNSYERELVFPISGFLKEKLETRKEVIWLDICCGSGKALIKTAKTFNDQNLKIIGIDLVGMFDAFSPELKDLNLTETSFEDFNSIDKFDLITCVHGLHYIGDKLKFIQKSVASLKPNGIFLANLDLTNFKFQNEKSAGRTIVKDLRSSGLKYISRKHLLICKGQKNINFDLQYLGANDKAGANYTKQNVVDSYYNSE